MIPPLDALARLREGNRRFVAGMRDEVTVSTRRAEVLGGQTPFAVVLGCSDSRVPVEIVFDQGLGDLFVIRVAGNIVAPSLIGSVEFAAEAFGTRLVVVLGHTRCGAVAATLEALRQPDSEHSPNLRAIVERIRPAIEGLIETDLRDDPERLAREAVRSNVRASANQIRHSSQSLENLVERGQLLIVGAEYALETGEVTFFDGVTETE